MSEHDATKQNEEIRKRFGVNKEPNINQKVRLDRIEKSFVDLALCLSEHCPQSRELATVLTLLTQAQSLSRSAILINEP